MKKIMNVITIMMAMLLLTACGGSKGTPIDFGDDEAFEAALNAGENLEGKVVRFSVDEVHPQSALGYNIWSGEHLNFVSSRNPGYKEGDLAIVRATVIESSLGSWVIQYEIVEDGVITEQTILSTDKPDSTQSSSENSATKDVNEDDSQNASFATTDEITTKPQPLEITDYGWYMNPVSSYDDTAYVDFCAMIHNPNDQYVAEFPKAIVTVKNGDGSVLATEEQVGSVVMPGDTITLCGMFSLPISDITEDAQIIFNVDWSEFEKGTSLYSAAKTTDFEFTNVSERRGSENFITGEITNNFTEDVDMLNLSIVLRKDGKIVYMENTFIDSLRAGQTKAFEFQRYSSWPEHDTIECSAMVW